MDDYQKQEFTDMLANLLTNRASYFDALEKYTNSVIETVKFGIQVGSGAMSLAEQRELVVIAARQAGLELDNPVVADYLSGMDVKIAQSAINSAQFN